MLIFLVVLATVAFRLDVLYAEEVDEFFGERHIIMDRPRACNSVVNLRLIYDDFHNTLRQKVAGGIPLSNTQHVQQRLMYGLIYDCLLEKKADQAVRNPGLPIDLPVLRFTKHYGGSLGRLPKVVEEGLHELAQNRSALFQMIYPKATRFACARTVKRERNGPGYGRVDVACVYDKKAELSAFRGRACTKDEDCTYYEGSKCQWHLCYVPLKHP